MSRISNAFWLLTLVVTVGCTGGTGPAYSKEEAAERRRQEVSGEVKMLIEIEKKYGLDHPEVRQMKMEFGMDPTKPAEEQAVGEPEVPQEGESAQ